MKDPKKTVQDGYDKITEDYQNWSETVRLKEREKYSSYMFNNLQPGTHILEIGCGSGKPTTQYLATKFRITGVDLSGNQIEFAKKNVPEAQFIHCDIAKFDHPANSFGGICAFYMFHHFPRAEVPLIFEKINKWLQPGGLFIASFSIGHEKEGVISDWLGIPMYFSAYPPDKTCKLVKDAGLEIVSSELEVAIEFNRPNTLLWIVAKKPTSL